MVGPVPSFAPRSPRRCSRGEAADVHRRAGDEFRAFRIGAGNELVTPLTSAASRAASRLRIAAESDQYLAAQVATSAE
jgi:hypothetical protein